MKPRPAILLSALLSSTLFAAPASAACAPCDLEARAMRTWTCIQHNLANLSGCIDGRGTACVSFHLGGFALAAPHTTNQRVQVAAYGFEFSARPNPASPVSFTPHVVRHGFGVFTIDYSTDARAC